MTAKVYIVTTDDKITQIGGTWWDIGDAAGDIDGGDFWSGVHEKFPGGLTLKEIRIIPDESVYMELGD
jgi:hypothetical protein